MIGANAYHGVSLFFTVSGFLITKKLLEISDTRCRFSIWMFYAHRIARIGPCLVLMLAAACAVATLGIDRLAIDWRDLPARLLKVFTFTYNVPGLVRFPGSRIWDPLWSLSVEEMFYLGFPLLLLLTARRRWALVAALLAFVAIGPWYRWVTASPYPYLSNFDNIALGALAALITWDAGASAKQVGLALRYAGALLIALTFAMTASVADSLVFGPTFMGVGASVYLAGSAHDRGRVSTFVLERFGTLSYEIYLFHMFVLVGFQPVFLSRTVPTSSAPMSLLWFALLVGGTLALGYLIATYYSEPVNRLIRRALLKRFEQDSRSSALRLYQAMPSKWPGCADWGQWAYKLKHDMPCFRLPALRGSMPRRSAVPSAIARAAQAGP